MLKVVVAGEVIDPEQVQAILSTGNAVLAKAEEITQLLTKKPKKKDKDKGEG